MDSQERQGRRGQILDAALEVFSRRGVFATRIADIAAEAGIAYGLVYHYFRNKEEILNTIFEEGWQSVTLRLEEAERDGATPRDRLQLAAEVFVQSYRRSPQVVELLLLEFSRMSKFLEPVHIRRIGGAYSVVTRIIESAQAAGELRQDLPPALLMLMFLGGVQLVLQTQHFGDFVPPGEFDERGSEIMVDIFWQGVRPG